MQFQQSSYVNYNLSNSIGSYKLFNLPEITPTNNVAYQQRFTPNFVVKQQYEDYPLFSQKIEPESSSTVEWNISSDSQIKIEDDSDFEDETTPQINKNYKQYSKNSICVGIQKKKIIKGYQDTKNIPKNFGKAVMKYIKEHEADAKKLLGENYSFATFYNRISSKKDKIISIKVFKTLFENSEKFDLNKETVEKNENNLRAYNRVYRIMAYKFLRTEFQSYLVSNKKIKHSDIMNKYKVVLENGLKNPDQFVSWKLNQFE